MNTTKSGEQWKKLRLKFNWDESLVNEDKKTKVEHLGANYLSVFATHRLHIGINTEFKVKITPQREKPVFLESLPTPTILMDDLLVTLALMQKYEIINTPPFSKISSPIFAQTKPTDKLRILVELRRINHLIKHRYKEHNHLGATISDAAQHMAGKKFFCKLDCSQAYHWIQMADEHSVELVSSNIG